MFPGKGSVGENTTANLEVPDRCNAIKIDELIPVLFEIFGRFTGAKTPDGNSSRGPEAHFSMTFVAGTAV